VGWGWLAFHVICDFYSLVVTTLPSSSSVGLVVTDALC